ncbi:SMC family protein [Diaphorobacter caeni]|uniref:hypothetical protein n=1 Tax=Diaphorobacter caeni TaxID=2784387 RepID=UPI001E483C3C|nr:hypothetical protein [Diaphorobacter caeni]
MSNTNKTDQFYDQLTTLVDQSLAAVLKKGSTTNGNQDLESAIASSRTLLEKMRDRTNADIRELRELSEWDTFTIAFYGETNAGKSTLIETLRILLGDTEKLDTQRQFRELAKDLRVDPESLASLDLSIQKLQSELAESQQHADQLTRKLANEEQQQAASLDMLMATIEHKRKHLNLWQKLVHMFKKLDEEKALPERELALVQLKAGNQTKLEAIAAEPSRIQAELAARTGEKANVESAFARLVPLQDGSIIGNGRSDFTLQSHSYRFMAGGQQFQLVDVPGIEGDEKQVMGAIDSSVKKAHAVFYVTRNATPPGSGSDGQEGTIDKIKRQLGKQTEVWAVFNKSATNPQVLQGESLINQNDAVGLADMGKSLTASLGAETYKGHVCVSGMPAFLAAATCLVPNNPHLRSREKFLASMRADEILQRSGMQAFLQFLRSDLCQNFQVKIRDANLKKIRSCLQDGISHLNQAKNNFANAAQKLAVQQKFAASQIDGLLSGTSQKLKSECHDELSGKKTAMRTAIYDYIESDQSNDDFKEYLTGEIESLKTSVGRDLEARFATVFKSFTDEAESIIQKNQKNVSEILHYTIDDPFSSLNLSFQTDFKMDSGINVVGLISALGGAAALVWATFLASNPVGWTTAAVIGAVGLVFSVYKAVRSFFSSDYKKEQQRKSADENLEKVFDKLTEMLDGNLESASVKINEALLATKAQMRIPYEQSINTKVALEEIAVKMAALRDKLVPKPAATTTAAPTPATESALA